MKSDKLIISKNTSRLQVPLQLPSLISTRIYLHIYIHIHVYTYPYMHMYTYIHMCMRVYVYIHTHAHIHTHTHTNTHINTHTYTHKHIQTYTAWTHMKMQTCKQIVFKTFERIDKQYWMRGDQYINTLSKWNAENIPVEFYTIIYFPLLIPCNRVNSG